MKKNIVPIILLVAIGAIGGWFGYTRRNKIPVWGQALIVGGEIFILYRLYRIYKKISDESTLQTTIDNATTEITTLTQQGSKANYTDSTYSGWANQLFDLIDGCDFDTNTTKILSIFSNLKNDIDYLKLVKAFGVREIDNCGWSWMTGSYSADLPTVFRDETITGIADGVNQYFAKQGMKSRL